MFCSGVRHILSVFLGCFLSLVSITTACGLASNPRSELGGICQREVLFGDWVAGIEVKMPLESGMDRGDPPIYDVIPIHGKGLGVIAARFLPRGTKIIIEEALISVPLPGMEAGQGFRLGDMLNNVERAFESLDHSSQQELLQLHDHRFPGDGDQSRLITILRSNAYNTGDNLVGIFPKIARINHSCRPNAGNFWSFKENHRVIYAHRDIEIGEEITVSYIPLVKSIKDRQARLYQYGFVCGCEACQSVESSKRRVKIADTIETLEQKVHLETLKEKSIERLLSKAMLLVDMVQAEELSDYLAKAYHFAAVFHEKKGKLGKAKEWATKELEMHQLAEMDSAEALTAIEYIDDLNIAEMMTLLQPKKSV